METDACRCPYETAAGGRPRSGGSGVARTLWEREVFRVWRAVADVLEGPAPTRRAVAGGDHGVGLIHQLGNASSSATVDRLLPAEKCIDLIRLRAT